MINSARHERTILPPLGAGLGLALTTLALYLMRDQTLTIGGVGALIAGLALWLVALWATPPDAESLPQLSAPARRMRWLFVAFAAGFSLLTWQLTTAGVYTLANVTTWLLAIVAWWWAWWPETNPSERIVRAARWWLPLVILAGIVVVGAFFRFYRLNDVPRDPTSDHAEKLLDIYDLTLGQRPIFFPRNTGREPGQFYITFGLMRLFGLPLQFETLKLGTALIGVLAIPAVFLFAREVGGTRVGLIAAALFAISKWVVNTARMGLRFPYAPLPTALVLWLLWRYLRRGDRRDALWCGIVLGLGLHGYISFRIVPLVVPVVLGVAFVVDPRWRRDWRRLTIDGGLIALTALIVVLPLAHYALQHPDQVWYRVATRAADSERTLGTIGELGGIFLRNNWNALLAFTWRGDETIVNAVQFDPFLDIVTGAALLAGVLIVGYQTMVRRAPRSIPLLIATPVLMLPSTLSLAFPNENPSANRIGTVAPVIFTIAALAVAYLIEQIWRRDQPLRFARRAIWRGVMLVGVIVGGGLATQQNFVRYFRDYDRQYRSFVPNTHEIADNVRRQQAARNIQLADTYVLAYPYWLDGRNLALELGDLSWQRDHDLPGEAELPEQTNGQAMLFVLNVEDVQRETELTERFPDGQYLAVTATPPGRDFALFVVPSR